ncbi:HIRAN domain-containing protein [Corynebacterium hansenii]|uniref:HIRAN domain-containing protein n=1 Tax=Corynebacterium hansenii TaxID=394964 RepID=A0ABV7ZRU0_9CORY|nr:HIRAN domain-containing protein [Corynebacterium hansenii]
MAASKSATVAAVGEHAYKPALRNVPGGEVWVELIPEPDNPYDSHAISVRYRGNVIAYVPRDRTGRYWNNVCRIVASGKTPTAKAKIYHSSGDFHEVSLFILAGDRGLGSTAGLVAKADSYDVPGAYRKTAGAPRKSSSSQPRLSAPSEKFGAPRPSDVAFTDRDRQREAQRRRLEQEKRDREITRAANPTEDNKSGESTAGLIVVIGAILFLLLLLVL